MLRTFQMALLHVNKPRKGSEHPIDTNFFSQFLVTLLLHISINLVHIILTCNNNVTIMVQISLPQLKA